MIIEVKLKPSSKTESIKEISDKKYIIELKEPPEHQKANIRLINMLSKEFKIPVKNIKIKNLKSRNKIIEIIAKQQ